MSSTPRATSAPQTPLAAANGPAPTDSTGSPTRRRRRRRTNSTFAAAVATPATAASTRRSRPSPNRRRSSISSPAKNTATVTVSGVFRPHVRGFGFLDAVAATGESNLTLTDSVFVPPPRAGGFLDGDQVSARIVIEADGRASAQSLKLTHRPRTHAYGQVNAGGDAVNLDPHIGKLTVTLDDPAEPGSWVRVNLTTADVTEAWDTLEPAALRAMIFDRLQLPTAHTLAVLRAARRPAAARPLAHRVDLRDVPTFTIDAASSRDLDDAISTRRNDDGSITVSVHIADVSHHVRPNTILDNAAREVATSIYLPSWNRPMLPAALSEDALSLLPGVDRDTLSVTYTVDADGHVRDPHVQATQIRSDARWTYHQTSDWLTGRTTDTPDSDLHSALLLASEAAARLSRSREARASHQPARSHDTRTTSVSVTPGPNQADPYAGATFTTRTLTEPAETNELIERLMVAANEAVATWLTDRNLPGVFRTHQGPDEDLTADLAAYVTQLPRAMRTPLVEQSPCSAWQEVRARVATMPGGEAATNTLLRRHVPRATYVETAGDHFGLASTGYLHFTSPIRRYADLLVHRVVHAHLADDIVEVDRLRGDISATCAHLSAASGAAARAEGQFTRAAAAMLLAPQGPVTATITGFAAKQVFVEVPETGLSGALPLTQMAGQWHADDRKVFVAEAGTGNVLRLGDTVRVRTETIDLLAGQIAFAKGGRARRGRRAVAA